MKFKDVLISPVRNGVYKKKEFHGGGVKMINMGELFANPRLEDIPMKRVELNENEQSRFCVEEGDLLFARRSLIAEGAGKCIIIHELKEPTAFESSIIRARIDSHKADSYFLFYFFNSVSGKGLLRSIRRQTAVSGITGADLSNLNIPLPPLSEQRRIAGILSAFDDKIDVLRRQNATLEGMAQAVFREWFVEGREDDWEEVPLSDYADFSTGVSYKSSELEESDTAMMTLKNFNRKGGLREDGYKPYIGQYKEKHILLEGDILVAHTDLTQNREVIGNPILVPQQDRFKILVASMDTVRVRPKSTIEHCNFLYYLLRDRDFKAHALSYTNGSTVMHLSKKALPQYHFQTPPSSVISAFEVFARQLNSKIQLNVSRIRLLDSLRSNCLKNLING